jgi:hypothetical protein
MRISVLLASQRRFGLPKIDSTRGCRSDVLVRTLNGSGLLATGSIATRIILGTQRGGTGWPNGEGI